MYSYSRQITELPKKQVVVIGSGSAGATAAITAASLGLRVLLIERYGFMGGISTQVLDTFYGFFTPGTQTRKVVGGIPDQVIEGLKKHNSVIYRPNTYGAGQGITYDPEKLKVVWEQMARQAGVEILYHSLVIDIHKTGDELDGVIVVNKSGMYFQPADIFIDASGDADVAAYAGVRFESANDQPVQSLTTTFKMINVDVDRARSVKKAEIHAIMSNAQGYDLPRKEGSVHISPLPGVMVTNMTRISQIDPNNTVQLSLAESEGRRQALEYSRFLIDNISGYENATLGGLSTQIGVRESRRIFGKYRLTRSDVINAQKFDDGIAVCGAPIEEHHAGSDTRWEYLPDGETYQIPLRCLLAERIDRLVVAGRCISADHDAHASVRSMGQCMAVGQAAGVTAKICIQNHNTPQNVSTQEVQKLLRSIGGILE